MSEGFCWIIFTFKRDFCSMIVLSNYNISLGVNEELTEIVHSGHSKYKFYNVFIMLWRRTTTALSKR